MYEEIQEIHRLSEIKDLLEHIVANLNPAVHRYHNQLNGCTENIHERTSSLTEHFRYHTDNHSSFSLPDFDEKVSKKVRRPI